MRPTHLSILIAAIVAICVAATSPAQDGPGGDIVVTGRKMRKVRLSYSWTKMVEAMYSGNMQQILPANAIAI